ncbi:MAG TPA: enoyl-CoA hydratase-related protein [Albitalea sp.]|jgi:2-(1,2-epoxy-1,2-dihydrophenyl)acetyl-CoA isomerase|nr:enoyl-CoA hydratase-related protein [Albitalea sp.]
MSIVLERHGAVGVMKLARPEQLNALTPAMRLEMERIVIEVRDDPSIRALLITGEGRAFCSGGDISTFAKTDAMPMRDRMRQQHRVTLGLYMLEKPVIAAVNGLAYGVGFNLALLADVILASDGARFCQSYSKVGMIPDGGGLYLLSRVVGTQKAKEMILLADVIDAHEAKALGIVHSVHPVDRLMVEAMGLAERLAAGPTRAFGLDKALMARGLSMTMEEFLELEAAAEAVVMQTADHMAAVEAFRNKTTPDFKGH